MDASHEVSWNPRLEKLLAQEGEKALSLYWLHIRSEERYARLNHFIAIPVVVLSALNGATSIGSENLFGPAAWAPLLVGFLSIGVGLLNSIGAYFAWLRRAEGHKIAALSYQKLHRFLAIELSLPRRERMIARDLLKVIRDTAERLAEISPPISPSVISSYREKFAEHESAKPEVANGLHVIEVYPEEEANDRIKIRLTEV